MSESVPNINLYNFEDKLYKNCRYVLTSPRSLHACAKLNIQPVELLYQPIEEFSKKYHNFPSAKIEELFAYYENRRRVRLAKARYERNLLTNSYADTSNDTLVASLTEEPSKKSKEKAKRNARFASPKYDQILKKLPPAEVKRLNLAQQRCKQMVSDIPVRKGRDLTVFGHRPRPQSAITQSRSSFHTSKEAGMVHRASSNSSCSRPSPPTSSRSAKDNEKSKELEQRIEQARERRLRLENLLETYRRQLQESHEITQQKAREKAAMRLIEEQQKKGLQRRLKEEKVRQNSRELQEKHEEEMRRHEDLRRQKEEQAQRMVDLKEAKALESRNLARVAEQLREEMLRVYRLDSFDKRANQVKLADELGLT